MNLKFSCKLCERICCFFEKFTPYCRQWQMSPLPYIYVAEYLLSPMFLVQLIYLFHEAKFIHWCVHACDINFVISLSMINGFFSGETKKDKRWHRQSQTSAGKFIIFSCWTKLSINSPLSGSDKNDGPEGPKYNGAQLWAGQPDVDLLRCPHDRCRLRPSCPAQKSLRREIKDQPSLEEGLQWLKSF